MSIEATPLELEVQARRHANQEAAQAREDRLEAEYQALCARQERALHDAIETLFTPAQVASLGLAFARHPRHMERQPAVYAAFWCEARDYALRLGECADDEPGLRIVGLYGLQRSLLLPLDEPRGAYDRLLAFLASL